MTTAETKDSERDGSAAVGIPVDRTVVRPEPERADACAEPLSLHEIYRQRELKCKALMADYDRNVFAPAIGRLRAWCRKNGGHKRGNFHENGLGWSWFYCSRCGGRMDITGPDGQKKSDDERLPR